MFVAELIAPLLFFAPRQARLAGAAATVAFQMLILLTGNYTFFNLLTMAIALWLLDDGVLRRWLAPGIVRRALAQATPLPARLQRTIVAAASGLLVVLSATQVYEVFRGTASEPFNSIADALDPLHLTSRYGLFAVMTTTRPEIIVEGSQDGSTWKAYEFFDKPGDLSRRPPWVAPFQPRLDWQMWFAALSAAASDRWVVALARRLLEGSPDVVGLFAHAPGNGRAPRYVRALLYDYRFTDRATRASTGRWWSRQMLGPYLPPLVLDQAGAVRRADLP